MTEEPPRHKHEPPPMVLPPWVPTVIGVVLVAMASLAVYTGLRYRNPGLVNSLVKRSTTAKVPPTGGAPGEPEPGGSLMFPGASADANEPTPNAHRVEIGGGRSGVTATVRISARRGLITNVIPDDAMIFVNNLAIGQAKQFNTMDEVYDFPAAGSYTIRIVAPGYRERQFIVTADDTSKNEIARLDVRLDPQ